MSEEIRYGDDRTIHRTGEVNIERDSKTGAVVAVWYRCTTLPFTDEVVDDERAKDMRRAYRAQPPLDIKAVVFETANKTTLPEFKDYDEE